jgi:small-conductance mechanosensitive channel
MTGLDYLSNLWDSLIDQLPNIIWGLVWFIAFLFLARFVSSFVRRRLERQTENTKPITMLTQLSYWTVVLFGLVVALQRIGSNLTALLAGLGIAGFTIGFALQDVSKNFIAGLLILIQQPFKPGDVIEVSDYTGTVVEIDLRATQLKTLDGRMVLIPNGTVYVSPITNFTRSASRRVEIVISVAHKNDPEKIRQIILEAIREVPGQIEVPAPEVHFQDIGGLTFDFTVFFWIDTKDTDPAQAKDVGVSTIRRALEAEKIEMPTSTQAIYMKP